MKLAGAIVMLAVLPGCTTVATQSRPPEYYSDVAAQTAVESLFSGDESVLSDQEIRRILEYRYVPPELSRIALLPAGWVHWGSWSEEMAIVTEEIDSGILQKLGSSPRVYDASFLPSILIPEQRTVPYLREAAARYQADLLLVYRSVCRTFERYRLFQADSTRAYCSVEAVLLDVRTGLVPFTASSTQRFDARKGGEDLNLREAVLRAQLSAIASGMDEVSDRLVAFLEGEAGGP